MKIQESRRDRSLAWMACSPDLPPPRPILCILPRAPSDLHLCPEFDQSIARKAEKCRGGTCVAGEKCEQSVAPQRHSGTIGRDDRFAAHEESRIHHLKAHALGCAAFHGRRNVWILRETETDDETEKLV